MSLAVLLALLPAALSYVQSSAGLVDTPVWESGATEFEMADLDGDGNVDLVSIGDHGNPQINATEQGLMVWRGDGRGNWTYLHAGDLGYGGVAAGDINNDGTPDVAYGMHHNYAGNDFGDQKLEAALGDRSLTQWTPWDDGLAQQGQSWGMFGTDFADFDGDGWLDLVSISFGSGDGMHAYVNRHDGSWARGFGFLGNNSGMIVSTGDVDGDGAPDLCATKQEGSIWLGDGDGFFAVADGTLPYPGDWNWRGGSALGDVDGDGHDDFAYCDGASNPAVYLWRPGNQWQNVSAGLPTDAKCKIAALDDMDGDGRIDLVTFRAGRVRVITGNGAGTAWTVAADFLTGDTPGTANALRVGGDVDHNGLPDIVTVDAKKLSAYADQNEARCWREASTPAALSVRLVRPSVNRILRAGSVVFVDWMAAVPAGPGAKVALELSTHGAAGPFTPVVADLPDNGRYQWTVPPLYAGDCRLRVTVTSGAAHASAVGPRFTIARRPDHMALAFTGRDTLAFTDDLARPRHDVYRGDLARLRATGEYTQDPTNVPGAARFCDLTTDSVTDTFVPPAGGMAFYLVTAYRMVDDGASPGTLVPMAESALGQDSGARMRVNTARCP